SNTRDDTAAIFADFLNVTSYPSAGLKNVVSFTAAHETGHTFGLRDTDRSTTDNALLNGSDIMTTGAGSSPLTQLSRTDNFFTRVPLTYAESWPDGVVAANAFAQLAADPNVGLKPGAPTYVTGTGASDQITITTTGPTSATVTVKALNSSGTGF